MYLIFSEFAFRLLTLERNLFQKGLEKMIRKIKKKL